MQFFFCTILSIKKSLQDDFLYNLLLRQERHKKPICEALEPQEHKGRKATNRKIKKCDDSGVVVNYRATSTTVPCFTLDGNSLPVAGEGLLSQLNRSASTRRRANGKTFVVRPCRCSQARIFNLTFSRPKINQLIAWFRRLSQAA